MSELKESNTPETKTGGWKLFLIEVLVGVAVLAVWSPVAAFLSITQPWVTIIFIVSWIVFWMTPTGKRITAKLVRAIHGG